MIRSPLMTVMTDAVMKASRSLKRDFGEVENLQVSRKGPGDFVSAADRKAEKILREALEKARPGYGLVMEESGIVEGTDRSHRWHIDPLDGTTNFLHGLPQFAISVGLERDGQVVAGVVYDPAKDELFIAERGQGAYLNNRRIRVAARTDMHEALIGCGLPHIGKGDHGLFLREATAVMAQAGGHAPARLGGARPRLCGGRAARRLLGARPQSAGTWRPESCCCARPAASCPMRRAAPTRWPRARSRSATKCSTGSCCGS